MKKGNPLRRSDDEIRRRANPLARAEIVEPTPAIDDVPKTAPAPKRTPRANGGARRPPEPAEPPTTRFGRARHVLFPTRAEWHAALPAFGLAVLSAILLRLTFRPIFLSPLAFVALVPLFWGLRRCRPTVAFWVGWAFGTTIALTGVAWFHVVSRFNPFVYAGILPLAMFVGAHFAAASAMIVFFARRLVPWAALPMAMIAWMGVEYWMSIGALGMPYGLAQSQGGWLAMAQVASLGGMPLLSGMIVGVNLSLMETISAFRARYGHAGAMTRLGVMGGAVALGLVYGYGALQHIEDVYTSPEETMQVRVALLQPAIDQMDKYLSYASPDRAERERLQEALTIRQLEQIRALERGAHDLIVLQESSFTEDWMDIEESLQQNLFGRAILREVMDLAHDLRAPIMVGGVDNVFRDIDNNPTELYRDGSEADLTPYPGSVVYGGTWLIRPDDTEIRMTADYRKVQLMPFGETVPYLGLIPGFQEKIVQVGSFARGKKGSPIATLVEQPDGSMAELRIGPSICFEDQFPYIQRHFARHGANLYVNQTNDAWFDGSAGPAWHADMARWRSIETHIPMVRATNSGITCVIDATGRMVEQLPPMEAGVLATTMTLLRDPGQTVYTRIGWLVGPLALLVTIGFFVLLWQHERRMRGAVR